MAVAVRNSTSGGVAKWRYHATQLAFAASVARLALVLHAGFRPEQPRVPAGNSDGGQWTKVPGWARRPSAEERPTSTELWPTGKPSNAEDWRDHLHLVGGRGRRNGNGQIRINGRFVPMTPAQEVRLRLSERELEAVLRAVRQMRPAGNLAPKYMRLLKASFQLTKSEPVKRA